MKHTEELLRHATKDSILSRREKQQAEERALAAEAELLTEKHTLMEEISVLKSRWGWEVKVEAELHGGRWVRRGERTDADVSHGTHTIYLSLGHTNMLRPPPCFQVCRGGPPDPPARREQAGRHFQQPEEAAEEEGGRAGQPGLPPHFDQGVWEGRRK
jgi:hypothetical protein